MSEARGTGTPVFDGDRERAVQVIEVVYGRGPYASVAAGGATVTLGILTKDDARDLVLSVVPLSPPGSELSEGS